MRKSFCQESFEKAGDLRKFVTDKNIMPDEIQQIVYNTEDKVFTLFYWWSLRTDRYKK